MQHRVIPPDSSGKVVEKEDNNKTGEMLNRDSTDTGKAMRKETFMRILHLVVILAVACDCASAQDGLTLNQCLELAHRNSPALRAAEDAIQASRLSRSELSTTSLPQLKAGVSGNYAPVPPSFGYDPVISNGGQLAGQVMFQQSLYDGGMRGVKSDQLQTDEKRLLLEHRRADRDLTFAVSQSFLDALRAQRAVELQRQSVDQLAAYLALVQRLFDGGNAGYSDVLKTEIQLSEASLDLQRAQEVAQSAWYSLAEAVGTDLDTTSHALGSLETPPDSVSAAGGDTVLESMDLKIAALGVERAALEVELARRERFPEVSLAGDAGYLSSVENLRLPSSERVSALGYAIGVGIEVPVFNGGATGLKVQQRELELDEQRTRAEQLRRSLVAEIRRTRLGLDGARRRLGAIRENVKKAEDNFILTRSKYAGGASIALEVLSSQQLLTGTKLSELETLATIQLLSAKLKQLTAP